MPVHSDRPVQAGDRLDDHCAACKATRLHTVLAAPAPGGALRVVCGFCGSQHNYRGGGREDRPKRTEIREERSGPVMDPVETTGDLETLLRRVIREECGLTPAVPAEKWRGGEMVLRPGKPGLQEKTWPIETFFHKVVMLRNRLRVLEQQVNTAEIPEDLKVRLQGYVTGCYGTLTSFNVLFASEDDRFRGAGSGSEP